MLDGGDKKMEKILVIAIILLMIPIAFAECVEPFDGMIINEDTELCGKTYDITNGITIGKDDVMLNCKTSILRGNGEGIGIIIEGRKNVEIRECTIINQDIGIFLQDSHNNLIIDNGILKNRIGVRLLNSYENNIIKNNDKSFVRAVSSVNSKFNVYNYDNKNIERDFCQENSCNDDERLSPCVDDDAYCSDLCDKNNDNDCKKSEPAKVEKKEPPAKTPEKTKEEPKEPVKEETKVKPPRYWMYALFYFLTFLIIEFVAYVKRYDREGG